MKTWHVTVKVETTIDVEAHTQEDAEKKALDAFDPYACDHEVVEAWADEAQEEHQNA